MITFENVTKYYNDNVGLEDANIHIGRGDFVFLVGPSGAGKSTFIKLIMKEINADEGRIIVGGKDITRLSNREIPQLRRDIGIVFQDFRLLPKKTVFENVAFALEAVHRSKRVIKNRVPNALEMVGIRDKAKKYPEELSAGEQQRVAIARAIINNPSILIADEPTGNLDPETAKGIMDLLLEINETGTTIVMVTHAKDIVDKMQKRVVAIESGHIVRDEYGEYGYEEDVKVFDRGVDNHGDPELKPGLVFDDDNPFTENGQGVAETAEEAVEEVAEEVEAVEEAAEAVAAEAPEEVAEAVAEEATVEATEEVEIDADVVTEEVVSEEVDLAAAIEEKDMAEAMAEEEPVSVAEAEA